MSNGEDSKGTEELRFGGRVLHWAEDAINIGIAVLLVAGGVVLLVEAARIGITGLSDDVVAAMTQMLDTILLVFIFAELLYAVRTVIIERTIIAEPFLLVGIIASIKEILFLSLKAAELLDKGPEFARALAQIGVLGGLTLVLAAAVWILRGARSASRKSDDSGWARGDLRLNRRDRDGVDDVGNGASSTEVVDGTAQALQHRPDSDSTRRALHRFVGVVTGVEIWEDEDGRPPSDLTTRQLDLADAGIDGGVVLDRSLDSKIGPPLMDQSARLTNFLHVRSRTGFAGGVREHRNEWLDPELFRRRRAAHRDVSELLGIRVRNDRAVAVDEHAVGQAHEEDAGHGTHAGDGANDLERWTDGVRRRVRSAGHHAIGESLVHHQRAEVADVRDDVARYGQSHALVGARGGVALRKTFA